MGEFLGTDVLSDATPEHATDDAAGPAPDGVPQAPDTIGAIVPVDPTAGIGTLCVPNHRRCTGPQSFAVCQDGLGYVVEECPADEACSGGKCSDLNCTPGEPLGACFDAAQLEVCDASGEGMTTVYCDPESPICVNGECRDLLCLPGQRVCQGLTRIQECGDDGAAFEFVRECPVGQLCYNGACSPKCSVDFKQNTAFGCEYWVADLDNVEGGATLPVAVVASNPAHSGTTNVSLVATDDATSPVAVSLAASAQAVLELAKGFDLDGTSLNRRSFLVAADDAITVHAFNPLAQAGAYTTDASLLLPAHALGRHYVALSWPQRQAGPETSFLPVRGFVTIIATEPGPTEVTVRPSDVTEAGGSIPALRKGDAYTVTLERGDVLNLESGGGGSGPDLTGTIVVGSQRLAVFSGHECANVPLVLSPEGAVIGTPFCDHLEQQLLPIELLGTEYVADAFAPRSPTDYGIWRVVAAASGVKITTDPPHPGADGVVLAAGEHLEIASQSSFVLRANGPVAVGHYVTGSNHQGFTTRPECEKDGAPTGIGDPALTMLVPTSRYREDFVVLAPDGYSESTLNFVHPPGAVIEVDGLPVSLETTPIGGSSWVASRLPVLPGVHRIAANARIGVTVYGFDCDVSYGYPGGLDVEVKP